FPPTRAGLSDEIDDRRQVGLVSVSRVDLNRRYREREPVKRPAGSHTVGMRAPLAAPCRPLRRKGGIDGAMHDTELREVDKRPQTLPPRGILERRFGDDRHA